MTTFRLRVLTLAGFLTAVLLPQTALAAEPGAVRSGPIGECLEATADSGAFLACLDQKSAELEESFGLGERWKERLRAYIANHPDWRQRLAQMADRLEDRRDRLEDRRDRREDRRDRFEDRRDQRRDREDLFDRWEDRRDRREDRRDKWEDRREWRKQLRGQA